jgi:hypothetical protein
MVLSEYLELPDGSELEVVIPAKYGVCEPCHGHGSQDIFDNGVPNEYFDEPDFAEDYRSGVYSKPCEECNGERVVLVPDKRVAKPEALAQYEEALEQRWKYEAEEAAERRFFQRAAEGMARW